jgi:P-loop Domain of unknown function (DUF2791)
VIRLEPLHRDQLQQLLQRISQIHRSHYNATQQISTKDINLVLDVVCQRMGSEALLTPGELVRDFIGVLNVMQQTPSLTIAQILQQEPSKAQPKATKTGTTTVTAEFAEFTL